MISNFNLTEVFLFPVKDNAARKNFLIAVLVYLAAFIVPILPLIVGMGYTARIMRGIVNGGEPSMPKWDNLESMLKDGLYLFGVRFVYVIPFFIILFPLLIGMMATPIWSDVVHYEGQGIPIALPILLGLVMLVTLPLSLAYGIILPAVEVHVVANSDFAAGFRVREWWPIFRANVGGFILAYLIAMVAGMILSTLVGIAAITIILFCVLPFIMPAITAYLTLVMYAAFAHAYKDGQTKLSAKSQQPIANSQ